MILYNLFPRLVGPIHRWTGLLDHIAGMGFTWIHVNPFFYPGHSGSLYAIQDYALYHPLFSVGSDDFGRPWEQKEAGDAALHHFLREAHRRGIRVVMDLVANHLASDSPFVRSRPQWFRWHRGRIVHPFARHEGKRVVWGDLAQLDHRRAAQDSGLREYLRSVVQHYLRMGFDGFRCDAAHKVPSHLWRYLVAGARKVRRDAVFIAEALGCSGHQLQRVAKTGVDFVFNNFKWWDLQDPGFLHGHNTHTRVTPSVAFVESHDTRRLAADLHGDRGLVLQRYALSVFFSAGVMMPLGMEWGATRRMDVLRDHPRDLEARRFDLSGDIGHLNRLKAKERVFHTESVVHRLELGPGVCGFVREAHGQRAVVVAHVWGPPRPVEVGPGVLGAGARVVYGLRRLGPGGLRDTLVPGEVFASVTP